MQPSRVIKNLDYFERFVSPITCNTVRYMREGLEDATVYHVVKGSEQRTSKGNAGAVEEARGSALFPYAHA